MFETTQGRRTRGSRAERTCRIRRRRRTGLSSSLATIPVYLNWLTKLLPAKKSRPISCPRPIQADNQLTSEPPRMCYQVRAGRGTMFLVRCRIRVAGWNFLDITLRVGGRHSGFETTVVTPPSLQNY